MVVPGDIVRGGPLGAELKVVVDVAVEAGETWAVLRDRDDLDGLNLTAELAEPLVAHDHVSDVPGWAETSHGEWERS